MDCGFFYPILIYACHDSSMHMLSCFTKMKNCYDKVLMITKKIVLRNFLFLKRK